MDIKELLAKGDIEGAVAAGIAAVKAAPMDVSRRTGLFEILCLTGDLDRAEKQLDVLAQQSMELAYAATMQKAMLDAERARRKVLTGVGQPQTRPDAPAWLPAFANLVGVLAKGQDGEEAAAEVAGTLTPVKGTFNGEAFAELRDGDDLLLPGLELSLGGNAWIVDWGYIASITADDPRVLRDTIWFPVHVTQHDGQEFDAHVPALYVDSHTSDDPALKLGHATDWVEEGGLVRGRGRRMLFTDGEPRDLLSLRELVLEH